MSSNLTQLELAYEHADRLVDALWADPVAAQRDWDAELASLTVSVQASRLRDSTARRAALDGAPGAGSLLAAAEVLGGAKALTAEQADDPAFVDRFGDGVVSAFAAAHRIASHAVWLEVVAAARLLAMRAGRTPSLPRRSSRSRSGRAQRDDENSLVDDEVIAELALAAGMASGMAASRVDAARALVLDDRLPATAALLEQGLLDWARVAAVLGRTRDLSATSARAVEALLYATAGLHGRGLTRFENALDAALLAVDADAVQARRRRAKRDRRVGIRTERDGSALFTARGPAEALVAAFNGIDAAARCKRAEGDPRTLDQLRHDLFVTASTSGYLPVPASALPVPAGCIAEARPDAAPRTVSGQAAALAVSDDAGGRGAADERQGADQRPWFVDTWPDVEVRVNVTVSAETLMGLTDDAGVLHGYGPIPAQVVRDLVTNGVFRCLVVDGGHGTVLGVGRSTFTPGYAPGERLRLLAEHAFPVCDIPGCKRSGGRCDLDHQLPHAAGGATCICNIRPLCRTHHRLKTAGLLVPVWTGPPGQPGSTLTWVTRTGRAYTVVDHAPVPHQRFPTRVPVVEHGPPPC